MSAVPEWCSYWYQVRTFVKKVLASSMDSKHSRSRGGRGARLSHQTGREPLESSGSGLAAAMCWLISVDELASPYNCPFAHGLCSGAITAGRPLHHYQATVRLSASHPVLSPSAFSLDVLPFPLSPEGPRHDWFPSSIQEPASCSCRLYAGHRLARNENYLPGLSQG